MEQGNLNMPIKVTPYRHQKEEFKFVRERFGLTRSEDELNEQNGQSIVQHTDMNMRDNCPKNLMVLKSQSEHAKIHFSKEIGGGANEHFYRYSSSLTYGNGLTRHRKNNSFNCSYRSIVSKVKNSKTANSVSAFNLWSMGRKIFKVFRL